MKKLKEKVKIKREIMTIYETKNGKMVYELHNTTQIDELALGNFLSFLGKYYNNIL